MAEGNEVRDMEKDTTEELIRQIQKTRQELASSLYQDFFSTEPSAGTVSGGTGDQNRPGDTKTVQKENLQDGTVTGSSTEADETGKESRTETAAGQGKEAQSGAKAQPPEPEEDPMDTLNSLIGLDKIKHDVKELTDFAKIQKARQDAGLKSVPVSLHLVFTGNPGTGKTTVARILAKLYAQIGILSKGQLIEVDRSGLVAGYIGQTALKTQEQIQKALGGVLFIDEAYALASRQEDFGQEAIDTILKAMEDHRDDLIVIVAGYTEPMERFINSNPGLRSRFNKYIEFPDYTLDELMGIFDMNLKKYDYTIEEETRAHVREKLASEKLASLENFANARAVRNLFEEIITNQARRVAQMESPTLEDLKSLTNDDLIDQEEEVMEAKDLAEQLSMQAADEPDESGTWEESPVSETDVIPETEPETVPEADVIPDTEPEAEGPEESAEETDEE